MSEFPKQKSEQSDAFLSVSPAEIDSIGEQTDDAAVDKAATIIDVRRHSQYDGGFPKAGWGKATDQEKEHLGHLTAEGIENTTRVAHELVEKRLDESGDQVDFLVVASPTYWLGDEDLGQRAIETAKIYSEEIKAQLDARGLPPEQLLNTTHRKTAQHEVGDVRVSKKMVEAQMFDDPVALDQVVDGLRKKYGGQGDEFWSAWYNGNDSEALESVGAETAAQAVERVNKQMDILVRYGKMYNEKTGRNLEIIVLTHHEMLQPYALHKLDVSTNEFKPGKNEGFEIRVHDGNAVASVAGHDIELN
jgi:hypothetical protein